MSMLDGGHEGGDGLLTFGVLSTRRESCSMETCSGHASARGPRPILSLHLQYWPTGRHRRRSITTRSREGDELRVGRWDREARQDGVVGRDTASRSVQMAISVSETGLPSAATSSTRQQHLHVVGHCGHAISTDCSIAMAIKPRHHRLSWGDDLLLVHPPVLLQTKCSLQQPPHLAIGPSSRAPPSPLAKV